MPNQLKRLKQAKEMLAAKKQELWMNAKKEAKKQALKRLLENFIGNAPDDDIRDLRLYKLLTV